MAWIEQLNFWFSRLLADASLLQWAFVGGLALLAFIISLWVGRAIQQRLNPVKDRIEALATDNALTGFRGEAITKEARGQRVLERMGRGLTPTNVEKRERMADKLTQLGYRDQRYVSLFYGLKILSAIALPTLTLVVILPFGLIPPKLTPSAIALAFLIGFILPDYVLVKKLRKRQAALRRGLPDALDMLVVCTEAGLGLNAAIQRVAMEMDIQHPALADELKTTMLHMGAGMDSRTAMQELARRSGLEEMRSLVSTLQQSMRYGTSISDTLRAYGSDMLNKRLESAQEQAAKVSVKMLIPIALCMLPAVMLVVLGTPMIKLMAALRGK